MPALNEMIMELAIDLVDPSEIALAEEIEEIQEQEQEVLALIDEFEDGVITFIDSGERVSNPDYVDLSDEDDDDDEEYNIW